MRTLLLLRHAKSDWRADYDGDRDRPLNRRGRAACRRIGRFVAASGMVPERVVSSPALRARDTARRAVEAGAWRCPIEVEDSLYGAPEETVLEVVRRLEDGLERVCLVGHEPIWSGLVGALIGHGRVRMPTAALACIRLEAGSWQAVDAGAGTLLWLVTPKLLEAGARGTSGRGTTNRREDGR